MFYFYCMRADACKVGFTANIANKETELARRYDQEFRLLWSVACNQSKGQILKIESWWIYQITEQERPVRGKEFFDADPIWLYGCLSRASNLGRFNLNLSHPSFSTTDA